MTSLPSQPGSAKKRLQSFFTSPYLVSCGVVAIIVLTVAYSALDVIPVVHRDLQLLHNVQSVDVQAIRLEGELQYEIQESRRQYLLILLAGKWSGTNPSPSDRISGQVSREIRALRASDATIALTESKLAQLGSVQAESQRQFHANWQRYAALRDSMLTPAPAVNAEEAGKLDKLDRVNIGLEHGAFLPVEQVVQNAEAASEAASADHIREVSTILNGELKAILLVMAVRIAALSLLIWMDWRRIRAERKLERATRELRASEDRFRQAYDSAMVGMGSFTLDGTVLSLNRMGAKILGYEVSELVGTKVKDFMAPEFREDHVQKIASLPGGPESSYVAERRVIRKDGTPAWVRNSVALLRPEGEEGYYFSISEEITLQKEAHDRLAYLANYDPVTGLPNRRFFEEQLAAALKPKPGRSNGVALLYLEIDSFDFLKGTFGPAVADEILTELGSQIASFRREGELVARLDDHVFGMFLAAAPYDEATLARAGELRSIFHHASETGKHRIPISASIGIAYSSDSANEGGIRTDSAQSVTASNVDTLLKFARAAMSEARSRGGDSIFLADPALQERAAERHRIELALLRGLRQDEFHVVFQPLFDVASGKLLRFEALCRWNSAELGPVRPDRFIPIAEQTGLISEIGRRILHEALRRAKTWTDSGRRIGVAVNVSPMQFMRPDFTHTITEALALTQFPPVLLELEITEGIFIRDLNLAIVRIRELQRLGLSIALDDFGTGYSSLSYLQRMPIDAVKLDRSFVSELTKDAATVSMVQSVLAMARALNLRVVTEGVETEEQLEILRTLGCDEAQGYLLGRPESAELALRRVLDSPLQSIGTLV
jgi:PAS domain S-box-containing protein/diguanylate cyclase (GGDEF)-like protein